MGIQRLSESAAALLRQRLDRLAREFRHLPATVFLIRRAAGRWTFAWAALLLVQGFIPILIVLLSRRAVDALLSSINTREFEPALATAALLAATLLVGELLTAAASHVRTVQAELVQDHIFDLVHEQSVRADLAFYDSADFHDHLHRARAEAAYRPVQLLENLGVAIQSSLTLLGFAVILISYAWWLPLVFVAGAVPALAILLRSSLLFHQWRRRATASERRTWYLDWLLTATQTAAEIRLFDLGRRFAADFGSLRANLRTERLALSARQARDRLYAALISFAAAAAIGAWILLQALSGRLTPGDLVLFYQALQQGLRLVHSLLGNATEIYGSSLFLGNLFEFLELRPRITAPDCPQSVPEPVTQGIELRNVGFAYPGSGSRVFDNFSLTLRAGSITAIVGANGAGKSTLIKLLCRFYDPASGSILLDGIDLRQFDPRLLRRSITALMQNPARFHATFAQNIALGDPLHPVDNERLRCAAAAAGASSIASALPDGFDTSLGREFASGHELSAGQWQRLALARAFYRQAQLLILDEPTSAMDPWAEADWLTRFRTLAAGRTALLITHRFTAARHADTIHVLDAGRIVESGAHQHLLSLGGKYAQGWLSQLGQAEIE
ncbi:MAG: multidrug ABC transporter ATP-binding protein [Candidatus Solibacter sp.]|nr:multidrug ABC transporter ATP-binding protein [Candidatus Solibacter sp.]